MWIEETKNGKLVVKQINFRSTFYNDFNELYVVGRIASWNFDFIFPYIALTDELKSYFSGFYLSESVRCMCQISISKNKVKLEYEGDGSIKVFYR